MTITVIVDAVDSDDDGDGGDDSGGDGRDAANSDGDGYNDDAGYDNDADGIDMALTMTAMLALLTMGTSPRGRCRIPRSC